MYVNKGCGDEGTIRSLAGELKEAVDVLALSREGGAAEEEMEEKSVKRIEEILDEMTGVVRAKLLERGKKPGEAGRGSGGTWGQWGKELALCVVQCERAERALHGGTRISKEKTATLRRRVACLRRLTEALKLARDLRETRAALGITQAAAAERMEISPAYLSRLENAACNPPSARTRRRIDAFLQSGMEKEGGDQGRSGGDKPNAARLMERAIEIGIAEGYEDATMETIFPCGEMEAARARKGPGNEDEVMSDAHNEDNGMGDDPVSGANTGMNDASLSGARAGAPTSACGDGYRARLLRSLLDMALRLDKEGLEILVELARQLRFAEGRE